MPWKGWEPILLRPPKFTNFRQLESKMGYMRRSTFAIAAAVAATCLAASAPAQAQKTLRAVMHSDLKILDPIWTTAYIVRNHGYMVYDTLFATDEKGDVKPQMVGKYDVSADKLTYTFTLRDGLFWHDGPPVTAEDCVASIKRWGAKDSTGQKLMTFVDSRRSGRQDLRDEAQGAHRPRALALGKPSSNVPFMMPKRVAETDPNTQISDFTGSGPFVFKRDEWKPGDKAVYVKFDKYKPRSEPASGFAGGKVVKVDRVEWRAISDHQQAINALLAGEIDFIEQPPHDLLPLVLANANIKYVDWNPLGNQYTFRPNAAQAVRQPEGPPGPAVCLQPGGLPEGRGRRRQVLQGMQGVLPLRHAPRLREGHGGHAEVRLQEGPGAAKGSRLRRHADRADALHRPARAHQPRAGGQVADGEGRLQGRHAVDGLADRGRAPRQEGPADAGGWHAFLTSWVSADITNPIFAGFMNSGCDKAMLAGPATRHGKAAR